jgi:hypothetical protein
METVTVTRAFRAAAMIMIRTHRAPFDSDLRATRRARGRPGRRDS